MTAQRASASQLSELISEAGRVPFYPAVVPAAFVLDVWQKTGVDPVLLVRPIAIAVLVAAAVTAVAVAVARNRHYGGVFAGIVAIGVIGGDDLQIAALAVVAMVMLVILVQRQAAFSHPVPWAGVTSLLNLVAVVMLGLLAFGAIGTMTRGHPASNLQVRRAPATSPAGTKPPDIVILLLDAHGRQDILEEDYGEDISDFVGELQARGFDVSGRSRSNYMSTQQTLASMFNFTHLTDLELPSQRDPTFASAAKGYLDRNAAFAELKEAGYRTATVTPGYDGVSFRSSDVFMDGGQINELEAALITNSILREALRVAAPDAFPSQIRDRVRWNLSPGNWLPALADGGAPFFLFIHVPSPHAPFVFGRDGQPKLDPEIEFIDQTPFSNRTPEDVAEVAHAYADQLAYVDDLTISALDNVLSSVPSDSVVIVMSDHGPDAHVDWDHLATTDTRERFGNFFAARTPGAPNLFGDAPTPVNIFPTLLNHYLGSMLPTQSDSSFLGVPPRDELVDIGHPDAD
jgi:hypothetical protein